MKYKDVDQIISCIEDRFSADNSECLSILTCNLNPIKAAMQLIDVLELIEGQYNVTEFRLNALKDIILGQCKNVLVNLYIPNELKVYVRQIDIFDKDTLHYMEKLDAFTLLETKVMDRIMKEYWHSNLDVSGSIFETSTCWQILSQLSD